MGFSLHVVEIYNNSSNDTVLGDDISIRDQPAPLICTWTANYTGFMTTTYVQPEHLTLSVRKYTNTSNHSFAWIILAEGEWLSSSAHGMNVEETHIISICKQMLMMLCMGLMTQLRTNPAMYTRPMLWVSQQVCLATEQSSTMGASTDIVGEVYVCCYGGIDNECQALLS